jgi:translation initiation factor 5
VVQALLLLFLHLQLKKAKVVNHLKVIKNQKKNGGTGSNSPTSNNNGTQLAVDRINEDFDEFDDFDQNELTTDEYNKRMREICDGFSSGMYMNDLKGESGNLFYKIVKEKKEANLLADQQVQKELFEEAKRFDIKDKSTLILSELLFTENMIDEIKTYKMLLLRFCVGNKKAQKYLLGGYEKLVGDVYKDKLFNNALKILKQFYEEEVLDEDVILEWSAKESKKYVSKEMSKKIHEKVAPFIKWLKEAEVEDSENDDEESGVSTGNNNKAEKQQQQRQESVESENDDIDIDFSHRATADCITVETVKPVVIVPINADVLVVDSNGTVPVGQDDIDIDNI